MSYKPINSRSGGSGVNTGDVIFQIGGPSGSVIPDDTFQIGSTAGVMDVYASGDGTNYLTAPIALIDLCSTSPAVEVLTTVANKHYGFRGNWKAIQVRQNGGTGVLNAYLIHKESA